MKRLMTMALAALCAGVSFPACGSGPPDDTREIAVDYRNDDFSGSYLAFYPRTLTVKPGMTVRFRQTWTGEPHTVALGRSVDDAVKPFKRLVDEYYVDHHSLEDEPESAFEGFDFKGRLPQFFTGDNFDQIDQAGALPCYVDEEDQLPLDGSPCKPQDRRQPKFTGRQAYYSSGFIPFEGARSNTWDLTIADDAEEGTYFYYCVLHSIFMSGEITVDRDAKVESQEQINRRGKAEADKLTKPVAAVLAKEREGKGAFPLPVAGSGDETTEFLHAFAAEFTPRTIKAKLGVPVKWTFNGDHTISFNVPSYTPLFTFDDKRLLQLNVDLYKPRVWPGAPERPGDNDHPPPPVSVDAGRWDGTGGMHSSGAGWISGDTYSITFTKKGTYPFACLIHPGMIGSVDVT